MNFMKTRWDFGEDVRVTRNVRNDGTFPGAELGELLVRRGSIGTVVDIGTFLQDQVIYSVHFLDINRIVGCREEELIGAEEAWRPSAYEARERVITRRTLRLGDDIRVPPGALGEVLRVRRDDEAAGVVYHVHFDCLPGRTLAVPESALAGPGGRCDG